MDRTNRNRQLCQVIKLFMLLAVSYLFSALAACSINNEKDIVGSYTSSHDYGEELLYLSENGNYIQRVRCKEGGITNTVTGTWKYNRFGSGTYITFSKGFMIVVSYNGELNSNYSIGAVGSVVLPISRLFGKITIGSAERIEYTKVEGNQ